MLEIAKVFSKKTLKSYPNCTSMTDECQYTFATNYFMYQIAKRYVEGLPYKADHPFGWLLTTALSETFPCN